MADTDVLDRDTEAPEEEESTGSEEDTRMRRGTRDEGEQQDRGKKLSREDVEKLRKRFHGDQQAARRAEQGAAKGAAKKTGETAAKGTAKKAGKAAAKKAGKEAVKEGAKVGAKAVVVGAGTAAAAPIGGVEGTVAAEVAWDVAAKEFQYAQAAFKAARDLELKKLTEQATKDTKKIIWLVAIVLFLLIGIMMLMMNAIQTTLPPPTPDPSAPLLQIRKEGPAEAKTGNRISYNITVDYPSPVEEITLTDSLPANTIYDGVEGANAKITCDTTPCSAQSKEVRWSAKENFPTMPAGAFHATFTLHFKSTADNTYIVNVISGTATPKAGGGCGAANNATNDFAELLNGQSYCTTVLGDEAAFTTSVLKNDPQLAGKDSQIRAIYNAAVSRTFNPLVLVTAWWIETRYGADGTDQHFNCKPGGSSFLKGFDAALTCKANAVKKWMDDFERIKKSGQFPVKFPQNGAACPLYTEPIVYAYEWLTPVCHFSDRNADARGNFVKRYKKLLGI